MSTFQWGKDFEVSATFTSDWHIGSGAGRHGGVDRTIDRDADGLPWVPATSALGALREGVETLVAGLDEGDAGPWHDWATWLLGSQPTTDPQPARGSVGAPTPSILRSSALRLPQDLRDYVTGPAPTGLVDGDLAASLVAVRPGVALTDGVAADDMLRLEERAATGLRVLSRWSLHAGQRTGELPWQLPFLLAAGARLVRALGAKRHRGAGWVRLEICGVDEATFDDWLSLARDMRESPQPLAPRIDLATPAWTASTGSLQLAAEVVIDTAAPLLIPEQAGIPGSIPAVMLLAHVGHVVPGLPGLLRSGRVVVTDATPAPTSRRLLPWPRHVAADNQGGLHCLITRTEPLPDTKTKPRTGSWLGTDAAATEHAAPGRTHRLHATIDDATGRTGDSDSNGGLYSYVSLDAGQRFVAQVWLPEDHDLQLPEGSTPIRLGSSKKDAYGAAFVTWRAPQSGWAPTPAPADREPVLVVCESDLLVRNVNGRFDPFVETWLAALGEALGMSAAPQLAHERGMLPSASVSVRHRRSWNARWGLPRPSLAAIAAGSVLVVNLPDTPDPQAWDALQRHGLGSRRAEGFGRLRLHTLSPATTRIAPERLVGTAPDTPSSGAGATASGAAETYRWLRQLTWQRKIRQRALQVAIDPNKRRQLLGEDAHSKAALGRIREAAARGQRPKVRVPVLQVPGNDPSQAPVWGVLFGGLPEDLRSDEELCAELLPIAQAALVTAVVRETGPGRPSADLVEDQA